MPEIRGVLTAMVTPFDADGAVDLDATRRLARHLVDGGSTGWSSPGPPASRRRSPTTRRCGCSTPCSTRSATTATVIAGTGSNDTAHAARLTRKARDVGAHAVLVVTPYYNKPNEAGLRAHFAAVSEAAGETPIVLYNIPSRCVINLAPELLAELAATHENIVAVKQANNDDLGPIEGLEILAGNDDVFARTLAFGGAGRDPGRLERRSAAAARALRRGGDRRRRPRRRARRRAEAAVRGDVGRPARGLGEDRARAARA